MRRGSPGRPTVIDLEDGSSVMASIQFEGPSFAGKGAEPARPNAPEPITIDFSAKPTAEEMSTLKKSFDDAWKQTSDDLEKLRLLSQQASTFAAAEQRHELVKSLSQAFAMEEKLFLKSMEDDGAESWDRRPGVLELSNMVKFSARSAPEEVLQDIESLRSTACAPTCWLPWLKPWSMWVEFRYTYRFESLGTFNR